MIKYLPDFNLDRLIVDPSIEKIYANSFLVSISSGDISIVAHHGTVPTGVVTMSFISAKTLCERLRDTLAKMEEFIGSPIPEQENISENILAFSAKIANKTNQDEKPKTTRK